MTTARVGHTNCCSNCSSAVLRRPGGRDALTETLTETITGTLAGHTNICAVAAARINKNEEAVFACEPPCAHPSRLAFRLVLI